MGAHKRNRWSGSKRGVPQANNIPRDSEGSSSALLDATVIITHDVDSG